MPYVDLTYQDNTRTPLSGAEMKFLNPDAKIMTYPELYDYKTIEELFSENKKIMNVIQLREMTVGKIISDAILLHELSPSVIEKELKLPNPYNIN